MSELKFRAYIGEGTWCYAELKGEKFDTQIFPLKEGTVLNPKIDTWQQYTGLKDKNGKEIYEGDIVHLQESIDYNKEQRRIMGETAEWVNLDTTCAVEWDEEGADFQMSNKDTCRGFGSRGQQEIEVIGNIYENPSLLGKV